MKTNKNLSLKTLACAALLFCTMSLSLHAADNPNSMRIYTKVGSSTNAYAFSKTPVLESTDSLHFYLTSKDGYKTFAVSNLQKLIFYNGSGSATGQTYLNLTLANGEVYSFAVSSSLMVTWGDDEESNLPPLSFVPGEGLRPLRTFLNVHMADGKIYSFEMTKGMTLTWTTNNLESEDTSDLHLKKDNIDAIVDAMTVKQKANILVGGGLRGSISQWIDLWGQRVKGAVGDTDAIDDLGIPQIVLTDGPAGVRIDAETTSFPCGLSLASMRDTTMVERVGAALGNETLELGCDILLGPGMNLLRNPLCGRNFEYLSEDPWLAGKTAAAYIRGAQSQGVGCSAKHFACNNQETGREQNNSVVDEETLRGYYFIPFQMCVSEAKPWTFMTSYNNLNGTPTSENKWLITDVLRGEWGFNGMVMSDWWTSKKLNTVNQLKAGNDLLMPGVNGQEGDITNAIDDGSLSMDELNACVRRMLQLIVKTPTFLGYKYSGNPDYATHQRLSRLAAAKGTVLLKNDGRTLPLKAASAGTVALFGANSYDILGGGFGSGSVNTPYTIEIYTGLENAGYTLDATLRSDYLYYAKWSTNRKETDLKSSLVGMGHNPLIEKPVDASYIESAASRCDVAVITLARQSAESVDRSQLEGDFLLDVNETNLIHNVCTYFHAQGKKVIVILNVCGVIETASWKDLPDAILCPWLPGMEGGNAIADVLSGAVAPGGRLPMTWPNTYADVPSQNFGDSSENVYSEGLNVGRTYYDANPDKVSYPFGWGLSYEDEALLLGDVNKDGEVNIADLAELIGILNGSNRNYDLMAADLNSDGVVNMDDMSLLRKLVLK